MVMAPPPTRDSETTPCFHGCRAFLHTHFPSRSPPSPPLHQSLRSQQQPSPWDRATIPGLQVPAAVLSRRLCPCPGCVWLRQGRRILIPLRPPQISCFPLSLRCFSSDSDSCPDVGIGLLLQIPYPPRAGRVLLTLLFPPSSFVLLNFVWFCLSSCPVRYSSLLSAGILHALLSLKVHS